MENKHFIKYEDGLIVEVSIPQELKKTEKNILSEKNKKGFVGTKETVEMVESPHNATNPEIITELKEVVGNKIEKVIRSIAKKAGETIVDVGTNDLKASSASLDIQLGVNAGGDWAVLDLKGSATIKISFKWNL